jgi:hypothetical protein
MFSFAKTKLLLESKFFTKPFSLVEKLKIILAESETINNLSQTIAISSNVPESGKAKYKDGIQIKR